MISSCLLLSSLTTTSFQICLLYKHYYFHCCCFSIHFPNHYVIRFLYQLQQMCLLSHQFHCHCLLLMINQHYTGIIISVVWVIAYFCLCHSAIANTSSIYNFFAFVILFHRRCYINRIICLICLANVAHTIILQNFQEGLKKI